MKRRRRTVPNFRTIDIPVPPAETPEGLLVSRLGSPEAADRALEEVTAELGLPRGAPRSALAVVALARLGGDVDLAARSLSWGDFEDFCALAAAASGYRVRRNVRLRKPTRQIDVVAESQSLVLAIDCKHWRRGAGPGSLRPAAVAQTERAKLLMERENRSRGKAYLPVLVTVLDSQVRFLGGVPVVPLYGLKDFLAKVDRYDDRLSFVGA